MKKHLIWFVAIGSLLIGFALSLSIKGQTMYLEKSLPERKKSWDLSVENSFQTKYETDNKIEIMETPVNATTANFSRKSRRTETRLRTTFAAAMKRTHNYAYFGFKAQQDRSLGKHPGIIYGVRTDFTRIRRFASVFAGAYLKFGNEIELHDSPKERKGAEARLFSKVEYTVPFERISHSSRGAAWSNGIEVRLESSNLLVETSARIISDSGSIHYGARTLGNGEVLACYKVRKMCVGGGIDYTRLLSGHFEHHQSTIGKFIMRYN